MVTRRLVYFDTKAKGNSKVAYNSSECFWKPRKGYPKVALSGAEVRFLLELRSRSKGTPKER